MQAWCPRALFGPLALFDGGPGVGRLAFPASRFPAFPGLPAFPLGDPAPFEPLPCGIAPAIARSKLIPSTIVPAILPARILIILPACF
jgi:hypothetical protein